MEKTLTRIFYFFRYIIRRLASELIKTVVTVDS